MARALIVGCGCRGRQLGRELLESGWAVRGTSRTPAGVEAIARDEIEATRADPARPGEILDLVGDVGAVVWLLGSARGGEEEVAAVHGTSLERLLERLVETPVRLFVYEAGGSTPEEHLRRGAEIVADAGSRWRIPVLAPKLVRQSDIAKLGLEFG